MRRKKKESFKSKVKNAFYTGFLVCIMLFWVQGYTNASGLKFVQITDTHFLANGNNTTYKMTAEAPALLDDAIEQVNFIPNLDFVVFTGDLIDKPFEKELTAVLPHLSKINVPWYFAFGNHDICVGGYLTKSLYLKLLRENNENFKFEKPYYSFIPKKGFKVIVLDSTIDKELSSQGFIYPEQLKWLDDELKKSQKDIVLIFVHVPIIEPFPSANHRMKNSKDVKATIEKYKNPIGVFMGHYHAAKITQNDNVLYVSSPALISYPNAFRLIEITTRKNKVIFDFYYKETGLRNVQKLAKLLVFGTTIYTGEEKDRSATYIIKR